MSDDARSASGLQGRAGPGGCAVFCPERLAGLDMQQFGAEEGCRHDSCRLGTECPSASLQSAITLKGASAAGQAQGCQRRPSLPRQSSMATRSTPKTVFTCRECGGTTPRWLGKCPHCEAWNTLEEGIAEAPSGGGKNRFQSLAKSQPVTTLSDIEAADVERTPTGLDELDSVLGGGIVEGGVVLIGGDPGIGKGTLLLQVLDAASQGLLPVPVAVVE